MLLTMSLLFLCTAQILHLSRYWAGLTRDLYTEMQDTRLRRHIDWNRPQHRSRVGLRR